ncbi:MAG: aldehyde dehydrogenase [Oscillospiraceae bacterium]|nr:aldehyde dehydrogenase [Oscillospiraceae bacterium]
MNIHEIVENQRRFFRTGATLSVPFRVKMLQRLRDAVNRREAEIGRALAADLGKSGYESFLCETGLVRGEISWMIRHAGRLARERTVPTPLAQFAARSFQKPAPYGCTLIMSPWNYPVLLTLDPLADAIAAGNTAVVKPSAYAPATSALLSELIGECFPLEYVAVVTGGREENTALLGERFDFIFFTGSQAVGREVLRRAAEHLTPAVLELGGKSPCIVDETARLSLAARRIVFGKFLNCGQTCVAPDYILCHSSVKDRLVELLCREVRRQYGENPLQNPDYGRIVSEKHFRRLLDLTGSGRLVLGGQSSPAALQIAPTILDAVTEADPVMQEEIFGPILPVLTFDRFEELYGLLADKPKPLALYLFSENRPRIREAMGRFQFGGGCVNDVVIHLATSAMGFGGVGESGMGAYHGRAGFEAFSHCKSIVDKKTWMDLPMRYQPYQKKLYGRLLRMFLR